MVKFVKYCSIDFKGREDLKKRSTLYSHSLTGRSDGLRHDRYSRDVGMSRGSQSRFRTQNFRGTGRPGFSDRSPPQKTFGRGASNFGRDQQSTFRGTGTARGSTFSRGQRGGQFNRGRGDGQFNRGRGVVRGRQSYSSFSGGSGGGKFVPR